MQKIMFNDKYGLTKTVLYGQKTQTRRTCSFGSNTYKEAYRKFISNYKDGDHFVDELIKHSTYKVGEEVAIAQPYNDTWQHTGYMSAFEAKHCPGYNNKMFVKAEKMPHRIKITDIHVERLQDISDEDCMKEGIHKMNNPIGYASYCISDKHEKHWWFKTPREAFASLIDKVSGKGTWASNPWVFVYDFELIK